MSSFIGHSLIAITVFKFADKGNNKRSRIIWLSWLVICALFPDVDYVFIKLQSTHHNGIRITHSIAFSLLLPVITIIFLLLKRNKQIKVKSIQVILAGISHLVLDMLVGVTPLPLLFPLSNTAVKLPAGILPSAGAINLFNYYFYRNLIIELGIIAPICYLLFKANSNTLVLNRLKIAALLIIFLSCMLWSLSLNR
jgi:inner membrane protein